MSLATVPETMAHYYGLVQSRAGKLWEKQNRTCYWCGKQTVLTRHVIPNAATEDHVYPRGEGGTDEDFNVVSACMNCNRRRAKEQAYGMKEGFLLRQNPVQKHGNYPSPLRAHDDKAADKVALALEIEALTNELSIAKHAYAQQRAFRERRDEEFAILLDYTQKLTLMGLLRQRLGLWLWYRPPALKFLNPAKRV